MHFCIFLLTAIISLIYERGYYIIWFIEFNAFTFPWLNTFALKSALNNIKNKVLVCIYLQIFFTIIYFNG